MRKALFTLAFTLAATTLTAAELIEAIVVRVGDRIVTRTQYERRLADLFAEIDQTVAPEQRSAKRAEVRNGLVQELVNELLIKDRADRIGVTVTDAEVQESVNRLKQQYNIKTDAQFDESLKSSGMTRADMEARLRETLITNKVFSRELRSRSELTDRELRERYDREKDRYRLPERAHLREIVVIRPEGSETAVAGARQRANDIAAMVRAPGADFAKTAGSASESGTKDRGGDLGEVTRGELLPDLDKAVFNSPAGTVLGPIETQSGWHILLVESRLPSEVPAFESVKDRLRKDANEDTFQRDLKAYIENLRKDAFIQVNEQYVPKT